MTLALLMLAQIAPVPLGEIRRAPFEPKVEIEAPPPKPRQTERPKLWWQPLPPGWVACSIDPYGRNVCGNGYWAAMP